MHTIDWYLDQAREKSGAKSDRQLSEMMGYSSKIVCQLRNNPKFNPSDEMMIKIADIANVERETALLDLGYWRSSGAAREVYKGMMQRVGAFASIFLFVSATFAAIPNKAQAIELASEKVASSFTIYYGKCRHYIGEAFKRLINHFGLSLCNIRK